MISYKSKNGRKTGVTAYEVGSDFIIVEFNHKTTYTYTYDSTGSMAVETMKSHAFNSHGLSTYIAQNNPMYESKRSSLSLQFKWNLGNLFKEKKSTFKNHF